MTNKEMTCNRLRKAWVDLELRKGELAKEIWAIEAKQEVLKSKLKCYGEFERALQEFAEVDEVSHPDMHDLI